MSGIAIITDSNSGITPEMAKELGVIMEPMIFEVGGVTYREHIDITFDEFYEKLEKGENVCTSQPVPADVTDLWDEVLKDYDEIIHIPMSSGLSGTCQTALALAQDYDGKVKVIDNQRISVTQAQSVFDAIALRDKGYNASQISDILHREKMESSIYIMVDTLKYLVKGGRLTPAVALMGKLLHIKPVLQIQGEKLDTFSKARTVKQAENILIDAVKNDMENRFGADYSGKDVHIAMAHSHNEEACLNFKKKVEKAFPGYDIYVSELPLSISCHIGPGSLALTCTKVVPELRENPILSQK